MEKSKLGTILSSRLDLPEKVKPQPWYRERLDSKYVRKGIDTSRWIFIKDGLDDFRDGKPPKLDDSILIKRNLGMRPNLKYSDSSPADQQPFQRIQKSLDPFDEYYCKSIPNQRRRLKRVSTLEDSVLNGPLAYLPEENDLPETIMQDVSEILDLPGSKNNSAISCLNSLGRDLDTSNSTVSNMVAIKEADETTRRAYNLYKKHSSSLSSSDEQTQASEDSQNNKPVVLPSGMDQVELVTKEFCDWVKNIGGGEGNNIEEDTIKELFVCAYEGDPSTSVVQTMNLSKVPSELLADAQLSRHTCIKRNVASRGAMSYNVDKIKYGVWYLPPNTWRARPANMLLQDEKKLEENPKPVEKRNELDRLLPSLHSAQTFLNFSREKNYSRKPELLRNVEINESFLKLEKDDLNSLPSIVQ